jgi:hypothetical protein
MFVFDYGRLVVPRVRQEFKGTPRSLSVSQHGEPFVVMTRERKGTEDASSSGVWRKSSSLQGSTCKVCFIAEWQI